MTTARLRNASCWLEIMAAQLPAIARRHLLRVISPIQRRMSADHGTQASLVLVQLGGHDDGRLLVLAHLLVGCADALYRRRRPTAGTARARPGQRRASCRVGRRRHADPRGSSIHWLQEQVRIEAARAEAKRIRIADAHVGDAQRRLADLAWPPGRGTWPAAAARPRWASDPARGPVAVDLDHQVRVALEDVAVDLLDAACPCPSSPASRRPPRPVAAARRSRGRTASPRRGRLAPDRSFSSSSMIWISST